MDVDDPPTPSSDDMHPQEHPSIATIEDEERPLGRDDSPSDPGSPNGSKVPIQRPKYRSYRDQHSTVPMPCLIDQCSHTSWMPKEREKHMDTHFHKRWQCGSCKKWYSTSYTLKRHSDSTHVPDACKGGYEAGNYASVPPYWTMPEYIHRVRMPEPTDYLYPALAPVFKKREELLASGLLNKRPLPDDLRVSASEAPRKRVKRRAMRKPVEDDQKPLADVSMNMQRAESAAPLDRHDRERSASVSPATESALEMQKPHTPGMHPKQEPRAAVASIEHLKLPPVPSVSICTEKARYVIQSPVTTKTSCLSVFISDLCLRLWLVDHPKSAIIEFERYWNGVTGEERKVSSSASSSRTDSHETTPNHRHMRSCLKLGNSETNENLRRDYNRAIV